MPASWYYNPLPWLWTGPSILVLTNCGKSDGMLLSLLGYKRETSILLVLSFLLACSLWLFSCAGLCGEGSLARNWAWHSISSQWRAEASVQQLRRNWILPTTTWVVSEVDSSLVGPSCETAVLADTLILASWETPRQISSFSWIPDP